MTTARTVTDLVKDVLLMLNVVNPSETPSSADFMTVYGVVQDVLAEWSDGEVTIPISTLENFSLISGTASYTIGENGTPSKSTVRPEQIIRAFIRDSDSDHEVKIIGEREYAAILNKSSPGQPEFMWVNYSSPNVTIHLHPTPDAAYTLYFLSIKPFTEPVTYTDSLLNTVGIPRVAYNALKYAAAIEVAPYFEKQPSELMMRRAAVTKGALIGLNLARSFEAVPMEIGGTRHGNILNLG